MVNKITNTHLNQNKFAFFLFSLSCLYGCPSYVAQLWVTYKTTSFSLVYFAGWWMTAVWWNQQLVIWKIHLRSFEVRNLLINILDSLFLSRQSVSPDTNNVWLTSLILMYLSYRKELYITSYYVFQVIISVYTETVIVSALDLSKKDDFVTTDVVVCFCYLQGFFFNFSVKYIALYFLAVTHPNAYLLRFPKSAKVG